MFLFLLALLGLIPVAAEEVANQCRDVADVDAAVAVHVATLATKHLQLMNSPTELLTAAVLQPLPTPITG